MNAKKIVMERTPEGKPEEAGLVEGRKKVSKEKSGPSGTPFDLVDRVASRTDELYVLYVSDTQ